MLNLCNLPKKGPVHFNVCNTILNKNICLEDIDVNKNSD